MSNHRTDIREAVKAQLDVANIVPVERIHTSRAKPITAEMMPALLVYMGEEKRGPSEQDMSHFHRRISLVIEAALPSNADVIETELETMAKAIEDAIEADRTLGNLVIETRWQSTEPDIVSNGRTLIGAVRVEYEIEVYTNEYIAKGMGMDEEMPLPTEVHVTGHIKPPPQSYLFPPRVYLDPIEDIEPIAPGAPFTHGTEGVGQ